MGGDQLMANQRVGDLPGGVGAADVGIGVIDPGDPLAEHGQGLAGALGLGQFGHGLSLVSGRARSGHRAISAGPGGGASAS